jgi:hypothetical protein
MADARQEGGGQANSAEFSGSIPHFMGQRDLSEAGYGVWI